MTELVGIPYTDGGLTPDQGFDCYGLVRWVLMAGLGRELPEKPPPAIRWPDYVEIFRPRPPALQQFDVLMFAEILPGLVNHIGVMVSAADFLHAGSKFGGVVCEPINRYLDKVVAVGRPHDS